MQENFGILLTTRSSPLKREQNLEIDFFPRIRLGLEKKNLVSDPAPDPTLVRNEAIRFYKPIILSLNVGFLLNNFIHP